MRGGRPWAVVLGGVGVITVAAAVILLAIGSGMMAEANTYFSQFDFSSASAVEIDQVEFDAYNALYSRGSTLSALAAPLLFSALGSMSVLLAVLSQRYDVTHRRRVAAGQTEASAAS